MTDFQSEAALGTYRDRAVFMEWRAAGATLAQPKPEP